MNKINTSYIIESLISEKEIKNRVSELGDDINNFYQRYI